MTMTAPGSTKYCPHCVSTKLLTDFAKHPKRPDGRSGWCKRCLADAKAMWKQTKMGKPQPVAING